MTHRDYVIRGCAAKGLDLIKPKKGNPGILALNKSGSVVIDAGNWKSARDQLDAANAKGEL